MGVAKRACQRHVLTKGTMPLQVVLCLDHVGRSVVAEGAVCQERVAVGDPLDGVPVPEIDVVAVKGA